MKTSAHISPEPSPSEEPLEPEASKAPEALSPEQRIARLRDIEENGVEVPDVPDWRFLPIMTLGKAIALWQSYQRGQQDGKSWLEFFNELAASDVFIVPGIVWLRLQIGAGGMFAHIHGNTLNEHAFGRSEAASMLLQAYMRHHNLNCIVGMPPDHNKITHRWLEQMGFELVGVFPFAGRWDGEPHSSVIYVLYRKE